MKYLLAITAFLITIVILGSFEFPVFWKIIAAGIVALGIFFAFDSHNIDQSPGTGDSIKSLNLGPSDDLANYLPINEYNKKFGMPTNKIKDKISAGELNGARVNGIWYIHADEMQN